MFLVSDKICLNFYVQVSLVHILQRGELTKQAHNILLRDVEGDKFKSRHVYVEWFTLFFIRLHMKPQLQSSHPLRLPSVSLHVRRSSCVEMTGVSQRYDTFGSLFYPSWNLFFYFFIPVGRHHRLSLDFHTGPRRDTHQVILLFGFSPNRDIGECFESAVGFFWRAPHINSEEPALLSHMVQHPLINATLCCVTKSQLHRAFYDWSALTVVDGI